MSIRNDIELVAADALVAYLQSVISTDTQTVCPIVSWHDPMSIDESDRIIVTVPTVKTEDWNVGNAECSVEIIVKTQWAENEVEATKATHFSRLNDVRSVLSVEGLTALVQAETTTLGINGIEHSRQASTRISQVFLVSQTDLTMHVFTKEVA